MSRLELALAATGALTIAGAALFFVWFVVMVVLEIVSLLVRGRRGRKQAMIERAQRGIANAADRALEAAEDEIRWQLILDATQSLDVPPPAPVDVPVPFVPRVIQGIDHSPHRRDRG